jgi:hypothetical protein
VEWRFHFAVQVQDMGRKMRLHPSVSGRPSEQSERTSHVRAEIKGGVEWLNCHSGDLDQSE